MLVFTVDRNTDSKIAMQRNKMSEMILTSNMQAMITVGLH